MTALGITKLIHLLSLLGLLYASWMKNRLLSPTEISRDTLLRVRTFDKLSAATAGIMLLTGFAMLLWLGKPTAYYMAHPGFMAKLLIYIVASALVVLTKIAFRKALATDMSTWPVPSNVRWIMRLDFAGLIVMALLGHWIARGGF